MTLRRDGEVATARIAAAGDGARSRFARYCGVIEDGFETRVPGAENAAEIVFVVTDEAGATPLQAVALGC